MSKRISRRTAIGTALAAGLAGPQLGQAKDAKMNKPSWDSIVIGAGVFGAWTAWHLRKAGQRVLLLDAFGAANARASSGGESRMTRGSYARTRSTPAWPLIRWCRGSGCRISPACPCFTPSACCSFSRSASHTSTSRSKCTAASSCRLRNWTAPRSNSVTRRRPGRTSRWDCTSPSSACSWRAARCRRW